MYIHIQYIPTTVAQNQITFRIRMLRNKLDILWKQLCKPIVAKLKYPFVLLDCAIFHVP